MKNKADALQTAWLSLLMISLGISVGQKMIYASEISVVTIWIAAILGFFNIGTQMKAKHEEITERIDAFRYRGLYPPKGEGSDDDVKRLKAAGEKGLALRLYLELHAVPLKEAKRAFDAL